MGNLRPSGRVIARNVTEDNFLKDHLRLPTEWIDGLVIALDDDEGNRHSADVAAFLYTLFKHYLEAAALKRYVERRPLLMVSADSKIRRPDLTICTQAATPDQPLSQPPELIVEVVTPSSHRRDRVEKFLEYEAAGVPEYWIIDLECAEVLFYQRNSEGFYDTVAPDEAYVYHSQTLPGLQISPDVFWQDELPTPEEILHLAQTMVKSATQSA